MAREYKNFYHTVKNNEGDKCHYPTRLDTYGLGCGHNCKYCYAKSQIQVRHEWRPQDPAVPDIEAVRRKIAQLQPGQIVRLGGMTDCFQPAEEKYKITYEAIKAMNKNRIGYLIVTKSALVASDEYMAIMDKELAHIQISITTTDDEKALTYENASVPSERIKAIEKLAAAGFDVAVRLSPLIPGFYDVDRINAIKCDKLLVEFLRNDAFIKRWFDIDWSDWSVRDATYGHLPLDKKIKLMNELNGFKEISVCEDCSGHYDYWRDNFNPNPKDCCNLRISESVADLNEFRKHNDRIMTKVRFKLQTKFKDGTIISNENVKQTYMETIAYVGPEKVRALNIVKNGCKLVSIDPSEVSDRWKEEVARDILPNGMHLFCHMSTDAKAKLLQDISNRLGNPFTVDYIYP